MLKVSIMYLANPNENFDMEYYKNSHLPMVKNLVGKDLLHLELNIGNGDSPYVAIAHLTFSSMDAFKASFLSQINEFRKDVPNYTQIKPQMQISQVVEIN